MNMSRRSLLQYLLPRLQDILFISIFLGVIGIGPSMLNIDGDLGRHITIGNFILDTRSIPTKDVFSHTMYGEALTPHEWLAQAIFAGFYRLAGLDGVVWFCALLIGLTFTLVYRQALNANGMVLVALAMTILSAAASSLHWLSRPHLFTMLLTALWVNCIEAIRSGKQGSAWQLPVMMLFWVNLHGAFIAGFVILAIYIIGDLFDRFFATSDGSHSENEIGKLRHLVGAGLASLAVTMINPAGLRLWETSLGYVRNRYLVSHTAEYLPPNFHDSSTWPFILLIVISLLLLGWRRQPMQSGRLVLLAAWTAMALYSVRNVPLYAIIAVPIFSRILSGLIQQSSRLAWLQDLQKRLMLVENSLVGIILPVLFSGLAAFGLMRGVDLDFNQLGNRFLEDKFPVEAVNWLESHPQSGQVFNYFPWGGYLLYRLWPENYVFIDGQTDFYGEALTREYEQIITMEGNWEGIFDKYKVDWVIMPADSILANELAVDADWNLVYHDATTKILRR